MRFVSAFVLSIFCFTSVHGTPSDWNLHEEDTTKMFCDLEEEFGERLTHMHVVEIYTTKPKLEECIDHYIDVASFQSIHIDQYTPGKEDIVLVTDEIHELKTIISSVPYGKVYGIIEKGSNSINRAIQQILSSEKKGRCVFYVVNEALEQYTLSWKPSPKHQASSLKDPFPYLPNLKPRNHTFISYRLSGGRLGDNLLAYSRAKWVAMKYGLPLITRSFRHFDNFKLSKFDYPLSIKFKLKRKQTFKHLHLIPTAKPNTAITIPYFPEYPWRKSSPDKGFSHFKVDWDDPKFKQELKRCLSPTEPVGLVKLPEGKITIAMHVRRGGLDENFEELNIGYPLKAPNNDYYIQQLRRVCTLFPERQIYVYLFTDSHAPETLCKEYAEGLNNPHVTFDWCKGKSSVLRDFFSIGEFDCLIRSGSNFSVMAGKRGDYIIEASPLEGRVESNKSVVIKYELVF